MGFGIGRIVQVSAKKNVGSSIDGQPQSTQVLGRRLGVSGMPLETLFKAASYAVIPFWLLLMAAPRW
ncbi:MAG: hypothetical protein ACERNK_13330, partial [Deltaproteobacteria bacterium]